MRTRSARSLARQTLNHLAMGASIGLALALGLMVSERHIYDMIARSAAPTATMLMFAGAIISVFAIGAGISGLVLMLLDEQF